jgi:hypothetical protein
MLNKLLDLFSDREEIEEFDNTEFKALCTKKKQLEDRIDNALDFHLIDLLDAQLKTVDQEINLIIVNEKKRQGMDYHTRLSNGEKKKERLAPLFVNGEMI